MNAASAAHQRRAANTAAAMAKSPPISWANLIHTTNCGSGSRLILSYDAESNAFTGTVENVTEAPLSRVRVEVHLSNGVELGPTPAVDLAPGASAAVSLAAPDRPFDTWSAHAEVGGGDGASSEHSGGGERTEGSGGEHGGSRESSGGEHSGGREN